MNAAEVAAMESMGPSTRRCYDAYLLFHATSASALTMTQTREIQACQDLGLYHNWDWDGNKLTAVR